MIHKNIEMIVKKDDFAARLVGNHGPDMGTNVLCYLESMITYVT
jgi:hypothetical protein